MINGHGDDLYKYDKIKINFSSNVYNHVDHSGLYEHIRTNLDCIRSYPEPRPFSLERALAAKYGVPEDMVCATNGATEAIYLIAQAYRDNTSAVLVPTFSEYADACVLNSHRVTKFYSIDSIPAKASVIWICNPNNPTGEAYGNEKIESLLEKYPDKLFIIDQSYESFTGKCLMHAADSMRYGNLVLLHSMTKCYAVPGLRLGYVTAHSSVISRLRSFVKPWSVNAVAVLSGLYLIEHHSEYKLDLDSIFEERDRVVSEFESLGVFDVWPTDTHYMLIKLRFGKSSSLKDYLADCHGILIRDASNFDGLDDSYFRIAVQTPQENDKLINAIKEWICRI